MKLKEFICEFIEKFSGKNVFGIAGTPNIDLIYEIHNKLNLIQNVHEANSIQCAMGAYLSTKKIHFSIVTTGVGVTNSITGLVDAYFSKIPVFLISTHNNTKFNGLGTHHDSSSLKDGIDTISLTKNCTCFSFVCNDIDNAPYIFLKAYNYALTYQEPVHISISKNLLNSEINIKDFSFLNNNFSENLTKLEIKKEDLDFVNNLFSNSKFPLIISSGDLNYDNFEKFINKSKILFLNTFSSVNYLNDSKYYLGNFEYVRSEGYKKIINQIDLLVFFGNNLNRYFLDGENIEDLKGKKILHISENPLDVCYFLGENYYFINADTDEILKNLENFSFNNYYKDDFLDKFKSLLKCKFEMDFKNNIFVSFLHEFQQKLPDNSGIFVDVGSVLNYLLGGFSVKKDTYVNFPSTFLNMGNSYKSLGYSIYNEGPTFSFLGDGSFYMNMGEIITAIENNLNINFVILNNKGYSSLISMSNNSFDNSFCKYKNGIDFEDFSKSIQSNYFLIEDVKDLEVFFYKINFFEGVNLIEIRGEFNEKMPL